MRLATLKAQLSPRRQRLADGAAKDVADGLDDARRRWEAAVDVAPIGTALTRVACKLAVVGVDRTTPVRASRPKGAWRQRQPALAEASVVVFIRPSAAAAAAAVAATGQLRWSCPVCPQPEQWRDGAGWPGGRRRQP